MVRGVRSVTDFDYETQLATLNRELMPEVDTVFLTPSPEVQAISSTLVREITQLGGPGDGERLVAPAVYAQLMAKRAQRQQG